MKCEMLTTTSINKIDDNNEKERKEREREREQTISEEDEEFSGSLSFDHHVFFLFCFEI